MIDDHQTEDIRETFWQSCREGALRIQACDDCGRWQFYPRYLCRHCGSRRVEWRQASGAATVESFSVVHRAEGFFADLTPYVVAMVALEEGPEMMTNLVGTAESPLDTERVRIGMPVQVVFAERDGQVVPLFTPSDPDGPGIG